MQFSLVVSHQSAHFEHRLRAALPANVKALA
jgi:hypothetical protein